MAQAWDKEQELHSVEQEWGAICRLIDKIGDREEELGQWDDLINMVADLVDKEDGDKDPSHLARDVFAYLWRLYFRIKAYDRPKPFNSVKEGKMQVKTSEQYSEEQDGFFIYNYDYKTYLWAKYTANARDHIDNNAIWVAKSALTPAQIKHFTALAKKEN